MSQGMAKSIFEYLTYKNPDLEHEDRMHCSLSREKTWLAPKRLIPWDEFNFHTMMKMFRGRLKTELMRDDRKLDYPAPKMNPKTEGRVDGEDTVVHILSRWTKPMVTAALEAVDDVFHPVFWVPPSRASVASFAIPKRQLEAVQGGEKPKSQPVRKPRACASISNSASRSRSRAPRPDGAGIHVPDLGNNPTWRNNQQDGVRPSNRLACEIKPGSMWTSEALLSGDLVDEDGYWQRYKRRSREAAPLVQVYNYCVRLNTRYGFLITSREIIAVRAGPPLEDRSLDRSSPSHTRTEEKLNDVLLYEGVMEYAIVPWGNFRAKKKPEGLTINLTLWVLCILAGQDCQLDWNYKALLEEPLVLGEQRRRKSGRAKSPPSQEESPSVSSNASDDSDDTGLSTSDDDGDLGNAIYLSFGPGNELPAAESSLGKTKRKRGAKADTKGGRKRRRDSVD